MKRSLNLGVAWFLVMTAMAATCEAAEPPPAQNKPAADSKVEPEAWVKHESKDGGFEVLFPGAVAFLTQKLPSGESLFVAHAKSRDGRTNFSASFDNYTANSADRYLEGVRRGLVARGELDKADLLQVAGKPAGDFASHKKNGESTAYFRKLIIVDTNRVYQLMVASPQDKPNEAEVKKFFGNRSRNYPYFTRWGVGRERGQGGGAGYKS